MAIESFVRRLQTSGRTAPSLTALHRIPARDAVTAPYPPEVPDWMRAALRRRGIEEPYAHQAASWQILGAGQDLVVVTPTASGKTLCYNVPVVSMLADDRDGCALYLYPTKALAQDQSAVLNEVLAAAAVDEEAQVYDGDTPADIRRRVREATRAVLTNPDMLHASILPNHEKWRRLFASLRYVIVDEAHTYRGVFGSHVANVFRRLERICAHYGTRPQFVFTSATIANPLELAEMLTGRQASLVNQSGAPTGEKLFCLYNPPIIDADQQRRQSPGAAARRMTADLLCEDHATIVFTRSRKGVEILARKLRESLEARGKHALAKQTTGYRGGYLPEERRHIERGLRTGAVRGVVSTNALELGIDIGSLDACIIAGYPGTIASTWQQAGRAGRRQATSLAILVAGDDPVDQYLVTHPEYFFEATPEHARIDADNLRVLAEHLKCAVFELPFGLEEAFGSFGRDDTQEVLGYLCEEGRLVHAAEGRWRWSADNYPASTVNIRAIYDENFVIINTSREPNQVLGEIDFEAAHLTVHEKAIYQHAGTFYEVHRLDYPERKAYVRAVEPEYFTQAIDETRVFVLEKFDEGVVAGTGLERGWGEVRVATRFTGYKKLRFKTFENIGYGELNLPDLEKHTTAYWCVFPSARVAATGLSASEVGAGIAGIAHAMHTVAIVHLMCSPRDLHVTLGSRLHASSDAGWELPMPVDMGAASFDDPTIYLYDDCPGGVGFSEKLHALHAELLTNTQGLIARCPCEDGCPRCVGPSTAHGARAKAAALTLLRVRG